MMSFSKECVSSCDNQAVQPIGRIVDRQEHPAAGGFDEGADAFLRGAGDDVLLLELAVGLEENHLHLGDRSWCRSALTF